MIIKLQRSKDRPYIWLPNTLPTPIMSILDKITSYETIGYEYSEAWATGKWDGKVRLLKQALNKAWYFPEGLLPIITQTLRAFGYSVELAQRQKPNPSMNLEWSGHNPLWPHQENVINMATNELEQGNGVTIALPTSGGKTTCAMWLMKQYNVPTIIIVPNQELMKQWKKEIKNTLNYNAGQMDGRKTDIRDITIASIQTLTKRQPEKQFDMMIIDECHRIGAPLFRKAALKLNSYYRIGLSATPKREDGAEIVLIAGIGKIITPVTAIELINQKRLTKPELVILRPPSPEKLGYTYQQEYNNGIILNERRNHLIAETTHKYLTEEKQAYVNVTRINHGKRLARLIGCEFIEAKSKNRESEINNFSIGKSKALVSTLLNEGVDIPGIDVIIMASAGKSATATIQRAGRVLRLKDGKDKAIIVDFADSGKRLRQHYEKRRQTYKDVLGV
jgi:superfamily II DNA or RNA helicase